MKLMRWAMCLAAFALAGEVAKSEDYVDIGAMQAKLAAQEARLNDLQAKIYGTGCGEPEGIVADGLTSLRKNATVTIGGTVNTRYEIISGKIESRYAYEDRTYISNDPNDWWNADGSSAIVDENGVRVPFPTMNRVRRTLADRDTGNRVLVDKTNYGQLVLADAKLEGKIDVNEYFDAYFKFDLQDGGREGASTAQNYWVRWKNVCNSGFGLLVGRDGTKFGGIGPGVSYDGWTEGQSDMSGQTWANYGGNGYHTGMAVANGLPMRPAGVAVSRTVQITPYWENQDGTFKAEVSLFQGPEYLNGTYDRDYGSYNWHRKANNGFGSFSGRLQWTPVEGLNLQASVMNLRASNWGDGVWGAQGEDYYQDWWGTAFPVRNLRTTKNNWSTNVGISYRPAFFNKLELAAAWQHGWNDGWVRDQNSDVFSVGFRFDILDNLSMWGTYENMHAKSKQAFWTGANHKANGHAFDTGLKYNFTNFGAYFQVSYRYERMTYKDMGGDKHTRLTGHGIRSMIGFDF